MTRLVLLVLCMAVVSPAQDVEKYRKYLDAATRVDHFSGSVLVTIKGQTLFQEAYDLSDRAATKPNTVDTI